MMIEERVATRSARPAAQRGRRCFCLGAWDGRTRRGTVCLPSASCVRPKQAMGWKERD